MKILFKFIVALLFITNSYGQDKPLFKRSHDIGKSKAPEVYPSDSIPLFVIKVSGKSKKIHPAKVLELAPKGNNVTALIPPEYIQKIHIFLGTEIPAKYKKEGVPRVEEVYIVEDKKDEALKFLRDTD